MSDILGEGEILNNDKSVLFKTPIQVINLFSLEETIIPAKRAK